MHVPPGPDSRLAPDDSGAALRNPPSLGHRPQRAGSRAARVPRADGARGEAGEDVDKSSVGLSPGWWLRVSQLHVPQPR